jgi:type II secretory pathway predicted ATPase ExeA
MYEEFYGLTELPFELTADPRWLFCNSSHRQALQHLQLGLSRAKALTVLLGNAGTGKSVLIGAALASDACRNVKGICLSHPAVSRDEFLQSLARGLGLSSEAFRSKSAFLAELEQELRSRAARGVTTALVADEAHGLDAEILEELRLLTNLEAGGRKLLPVVLAGQPELEERLSHGSLVALRQRVALMTRVVEFTAAETAEYVASRIARAGGNAARMFASDAIGLVHRRSGGVPRTINVICDNALMKGMLRGQPLVGAALIDEVVRECGVSPTYAPESGSRPPGISPPYGAGPPGRELDEALDAARDDAPRRSLDLDDLDDQLAGPAAAPLNTVLRARIAPEDGAARRFGFRRSPTRGSGSPTDVLGLRSRVEEASPVRPAEGAAEPTPSADSSVLEKRGSSIWSRVTGRGRSPDSDN